MKMTSKAGKNSRGFTLFELLVAIAIAGLAMTAVLSQMGRVLDRDFKSSSSKLARTIRYLYNKSSTENIAIRLVFDFENSSYMVEASSDPVSLVHERFADKKEEEAKKEAKEAEKKEGEEDLIQPREPVFGPTESYLLKPIHLPEGVFFKDIYAEHQIERVSAGKAYIYFFPQGYVEKAIINLRDEEDEVHYSLDVNPISGAVKIEAEYKDPEIQR